MTRVDWSHWKSASVVRKFAAAASIFLSTGSSAAPLAWADATPAIAKASAVIAEMYLSFMSFSSWHLAMNYLVTWEDTLLEIGCELRAGGLSLKSTKRGARNMNSKMMVTMTS